MATKKPKGLGRGLDALLGADVPAIDNIGKAPAAAPEGPPATLPVSKMRAGKYQPRTRMDEGALNELAESIRTQGIMQPILVRALRRERRFRAAQLAGLKEVPVLVREVADENAGGHGADREHPARRPQSASEEGARRSPPARRVRPDARAGRRPAKRRHENVHSLR